jgi:hypothetical protein
VSPKGFDLGCLDGVLKGERVAVVDALAAPLKNVIAASRQGVQNLDRLGGQRDKRRRSIPSMSTQIHAHPQ